FTSTGFAAAKKAAVKPAVTKKSVPVVLAKGIQISWCGRAVKDNGSVTFPGLKGVTLPVKKGKFDLIVPSIPVFGDEDDLSQQSNVRELDFGTAKVYQFLIINFENSNAKKSREDKAEGGGGLAFSIYYSDSDVKGTINGEPAALKKGWNVFGHKKNLKAEIGCRG
ncbi:MAG: hypothetical protein CVV49_13230, partial [Spirochaetae bacterium HGW-Spirochaetae-5]